MTSAIRRVLKARRAPDLDVEAASFNRNFLKLLDQVCETDTAATGDLEPGVFTLVLPPAKVDGESALDAQHAAIDAALTRLSQRRSTVASVTWAVLRDAEPAYSPSYRAWAGRHRELLERDIGIVFFVEPDAVSRAVERAAALMNLRATVDAEQGRIAVGDGTYSVDLDVDSVVAEALWTMRGLTAVSFERVAQLPAEIASFDALADALQTRFPGLELSVEDGAWQANLGPSEGRISYRELVKQRRAAGLAAEHFLARARLSDLFEDGATMHRKIKAPPFIAAFPDTMHRAWGGCVEVLARDGETGTRYVRRYDDDPDGRYAHLSLIATLSRPSHQFDGYMFRAEVGPRQAICLAGPQAVSLVAEPGLISGILEAAGWARDRVRTLAKFENGLVIADHDIVEEALEVLLSSLRPLAQDIYQEAGDALQLDCSITLNESASGRCELREVPGTYFELRERAEHAQRSGPPGRAAYYRGLCFEILGKSEQAAEHFTRALRYDRDDGELNLLLGRTLNDLGDFDRATAFLERAVHALPDDPDASNSLGVAYQSAGASQKAVGAFEHAAALSPEDPTILVNLGRAYFDTDRIDMAREILTRALERAPALFEAHASLAMLHFHTGESADALAHARVALSERPDDETMRELVALLVAKETEPPT